MIVAQDRQPEKLVEHFFRHEAAGLVAVLTRKFGFALIDVIEDMVQEALLEALSVWRIRGLPDSPAAWLHRVARNRVIDAVRRQKKFESSSQVAEAIDLRMPESFDEGAQQDSLLRMIFACCDPSLERSSQLALTLKVVCGLGDQEVARGLLISPAAAKKRVSRAKRSLQLRQVGLEFPAPSRLDERLEVVHDVLYLMFNEGYHPTRGDDVLKIDLCEEAARLCHLLCQNEIGTPTTRALLALMLFHAARFESRVTPEGETILLQDQDRSHWDRDMIKVAEYWLSRSAAGESISRFHLEAGIARLHCGATSIKQTDWNGVLRHYEILGRLFPSPAVELNRAIVLGKLGRAREGLDILESLKAQNHLANYHLLDCAFGELFADLNRKDCALQHWQTALATSSSDHEKQLIRKKIRALSGISDDV